MPTVLGGVFVTSFVDQIGSSKNRLQLVDFENEADLLFQTVRIGPCRHQTTLYMLFFEVSMKSRLELITLPLRTAVLLFLLWAAYHFGNENPRLDSRTDTPETG